MSSNLRNKSYVFKNEKYTREAYLEKMKEYELSSFSTRNELNKEFKNLFKNDSIHRYVVGERNINSTGGLFSNCKNVIDGFDLDNGEDSKNIYSALFIKNCMDIYHVGYNTELCYEIHGCTKVFGCQFCHLCYDDSSVFYSDTCQNSQNLFGCISIKKAEYMIFNKKYSKEEYTILKEKIIEHMKKTGEYGEFFPPQIAPVCYNETQGALYMPMTKEEVKAKGWQWEDNIPGTFGKETISSISIPDKIEDVPGTFLNEIFSCIECSKNFNITQNEFLFYKKENVPFPRKCPNCRYKRRFDLRLPRKLWHRVCTCSKDNHSHEGKCKVEFETPYAPDRPEKVYCETCYNKEVY
jgi:hypothetical protein